MARFSWDFFTLHESGEKWYFFSSTLRLQLLSPLLPLHNHQNECKPLPYTENFLSTLVVYGCLSSLNSCCCSVMSDSLRPMGYSTPGCLSSSPRVCTNSCPLSLWCHPTISSSVVPSPPTFNLFQHQGLFQWVSSSYQWPKYWSISFSNEYSGLVSFRIDWFDLFIVQGTLNSLLQHYNSKASIPQFRNSMSW